MCSKGIHSQVSINTLSPPLIDTPSTTPLTLDQHLRWHSIDTQSTSQSTVGQESTHFQKHHWVSIDTYELVSTLRTNNQPPVDWLSIKCRLRCWLSVNLVLTDCWLSCWSSVDQVSIEMSMECWSRVDQEYRLTLNHRMMPLVLQENVLKAELQIWSCIH